MQVLAHVPRGVELAARAAPAAAPPDVRVPERVGVRIWVRAGVGQAAAPGGPARGEELGGTRHVWPPRTDEEAAGERGRGRGSALRCAMTHTHTHTDLAGGFD